MTFGTTNLPKETGNIIENEEALGKDTGRNDLAGNTECL